MRIHTLVAAVCLGLSCVVMVSAAGDTRVVAAARRNDLGAIRALVAAKADVKATEGDGASALTWAAYHSNIDAVRVLLAAGAPVNVANRYGVTPLLQAARNGDLPIIEALLKAGADVQTTQSEGETPLMAAAAAGSVEAVRLFLARGANVNAMEQAANQTALMWAANEGHTDVVNVLLEGGANPNATGKVTGLPRVQGGIAGGRMWTDYTSGGLTSLMFAARQGHGDVIRRLMDAGADANVANPDGLTALILAVINDHADAAIVLLDKGAGANDGSLFEAIGLHNIRANETVGEATRPRPRNENRATPVELIAKLVEKGADPLRPATHILHADSIGQPLQQATNQSPLARALQQQDVDALKAIVPRIPDLNVMTQGNTPLMTLMAPGGGRFAGGFGAQPGAFRYAGTRSAMEAARLLLEAGVDVNKTRATGETALHIAAQSGNVVMIQMLVDRGAKLDARTNDGLTPLDYAEGKAGPAPGAARGGGGGGGGGARGGGPAGPQPEAVALLKKLMGQA